MTLEDLLMTAMTGSTRQQLQDSASMGRGPVRLDPESLNLDKAVHALATQGMTERIGGLPALGLGYGREAVQGIGQLLQGKPFVGVEGYDPADIRANMLGNQTAKRDPLKVLMASLVAPGVRL